MKLGLKSPALVRTAPAWTCHSVNTRFISSTTRRLSDTKKGQNSESLKNKQSSETNSSTSGSNPDSNKKNQQPAKSKSVTQADEELRERLEQLSGGGGASGIEYEDGQPSTLKRSVKNNMFRYI